MGLAVVDAGSIIFCIVTKDFSRGPTALDSDFLGENREFLWWWNYAWIIA